MRRLTTIRESSRLTRLRRLLASGYFPSELPPLFTSHQLAQHAPDLIQEWHPRRVEEFISRPELFSVPRARRVRRQVSIVNPINQVLLSNLIAENWSSIRERLERSEISEFRPLIQTQPDRRAIAGIDFARVQERKIAILARYGRYVQTDIVRFFPSLPTQTIAWGLHGRAWVEENFQSREYRDSYAHRIVSAVRSGQGNSKIGLPIGPDTSRILSEVVATELELVASEALPDLNTRSVRYVDDIFIGVREDESPDAIAASLASALYQFDFQLNDEKTSTHGVGIPAAPDWLHFIRQFEISPQAHRQRDDIDSFFGEVMSRADQHARSEVLLFATKVATSFRIDNRNRDHLIRWLLYSARRSPSCLSFVAEYLAFEHTNGRQCPTADIQLFIRQQLPLKASAAHTSEVAWLLFWARETQTTLDSALFRHVVQLRSSVCALLTLDLLQQNLIDGNIDVAAWQVFATEDGLESEMWLAAYEATVRQWWPRRVSRAFIRDHEFFSALISRSIRFYAPDANARGRSARRLFARLSTQADQSYLEQ